MLVTGATLGGRYLLVKRVARGGMGEVWRAEDPVLGRIVAVKVLLPRLSGDPDFAARFRAEARAMATLSDPGIVEIYDYGQDGENSYLVMQFIEGESLHQLLARSGRLDPDHAMTLVAQAATALHEAHRRGIVHRDVKPGNLLLRPDGRLVLTDFGIAHSVAAERLTEVGAIIGTAAYLTPEQVTGEALTPATDVYALGVVAYECLTQHRPFEAESPVAIALMHTHDEPPPLPDEIPTAVRHVVMRALAKHPAERWPDAAAMAEAALRALAAQPDRITGHLTRALTPAPAVPAPGSDASTPPPMPATELAPGPPRRTVRTGLLWLAAAGVMLVVAAGFFLLRPATIGAADASAGDQPQVSPSDGAVPATAPPDATTVVGPLATPTPIHSGRVSPTTGTPGQTGPPTSPATTPSPSPSSGLRTVPDVIGEDEQTARVHLKAAGLMATVTYTTASRVCAVIEQTPTGGTMVKLNSTVNLVIGRPPSGECILPA
jgi:serine/threonine protein kinase